MYIGLHIEDDVEVRADHFISDPPHVRLSLAGVSGKVRLTMNPHVAKHIANQLMQASWGWPKRPEESRTDEVPMDRAPESKTVPHTPQSYAHLHATELLSALNRAIRTGRSDWGVLADFLARAFREGHEQGYDAGHAAGGAAENQRQEDLRMRR